MKLKNISKFIIKYLIIQLPIQPNDVPGIVHVFDEYEYIYSSISCSFKLCKNKLSCCGSDVIHDIQIEKFSYDEFKTNILNTYQQIKLLYS